MAAVPPPSDPASGPGPVTRPGRFARWVRRPALAVALLGVAVAVSVVEGQPPPAARDSGVSVDAEEPYPYPVGTLLVVAEGRLMRYDSSARRARPVPLPTGVTALRAWTQPAGDVLLGRQANGRTAAYLLRSGRPPVLLGPAELAVPSADRAAVWLVSRRAAPPVSPGSAAGSDPAAGPGVATRVPLAGGARATVALPRASRLVAESPAGLIVSTGTVPDPVLPGRRPTPTPTTGSPTPTGPVVAGRTPGSSPPGVSGMPTPTISPSGSPAPRTATPTGLPLTPTPPPYTTASPVPSTGPDGVPLTTLVVGRDSSVRFLAAAEALAATGDVVLLRDERRRLGVISPGPGVRKPRWLPKLNAVEAIGPGVLDERGETFAVLARINDSAWLMAGPTSARTEGAINVVALAGGPPVPGPAAPAFTASGRVLTVRPDGRIVYYNPGERTGYTVAGTLPSASSVTQS